MTNTKKAAHVVDAHQAEVCEKTYSLCEIGGVTLLVTHSRSYIHT